MALHNLGIYNWRLVRDDRTHRDYTVTYKIQTTSPYVGTAKPVTADYSAGNPGAGDGPRSVMGASGLPQTGDPLLMGNDSDSRAKCHPNYTVRPFNWKDGEPVEFYLVEFLFSTRPMKRCMTTEWDDPLSEPQVVRGGNVKGKIEATEDMDGNLIMSSSHEMYRGPQVEFDSSHPTVHIEQNVSTLQLSLVSGLMDTLNDDTLWGLAARRIKLSNFTWEEMWFETCTYYYRRMFDFEVKNRDDDLWDRYLIDEGTRVLSGRWADAEDTECGATDMWVDVDPCPDGQVTNSPDPDNPQHFQRYKDRWGENARVILNGFGKPADVMNTFVISPGSGLTGTGSTGGIGKQEVKYYPEGDLTQLGIPVTIEFGTAT